jgi:hypothetical protein
VLNAVSPTTNTSLGYTPTQTTAEKTNAVAYDPSSFDVTPDQTVQGQLKNIIADDSPLLQQAKTRALSDMQSRGLLNSSLAIGAGHNAVIQNALPIAQQDASAFGQAMTNTVQAKNAAAYQNAQAKNQAYLQDAQLGTNVNLQNAGAVNTASGFMADAANKLQLAQIDNATRVALSNLDNQNRQILQTNQNLAQMFNQVVTNLTNIATNPTLDKNAKDDATATQMNMLNEALRAAGGIATNPISTPGAAVSGLNLSQFFQLQPPESPTEGTTPKNGDVRTNPDGTRQRYDEATKSWVSFTGTAGQNPASSTPVTPVTPQDGSVRANTANGTLERYDAAQKRWIPTQILPQPGRFPMMRPPGQ